MASVRNGRLVGSMSSEEQAEHLNLIGAFLARRDLPDLDSASLSAVSGRTAVDLLVLLGSSVLAAADLAARAFHAGLAREVLVCGGIGHSTPFLTENVAAHPLYRDLPTDGRPEAEILQEVLVRHLGLPAGAVLIEARSTNCGENALEARRVLARQGRSPGSVLLLQDPTMQRRSHASFEQAWRDESGVRFLSFAPFLPRVEASTAGLALAGPEARSAWSLERFVSLVMGEVPRLRDDERGYGPRGRGFIPHVALPEEVERSYAALCGLAGAAT
jgi:hypothetical protein